MTRSLENRTIMIVEGRSISSFRLRNDLEELGAAVCISRLADAELSVRNARPDAVIVDFSISTSFDGLETLAIPHVVCRSPNKFQTATEQFVASQHVTAALADLLARTGYGTAADTVPRDLPPELYAI